MSVEVKTTVKIKKSQFIACAHRAFLATNLVLGRQFQKRVTARIWPWPNITMRTLRTRVIVEGSPRDIVDNSALRDSYDMDMRTPAHAVHTYAIEYALAVHNGAVITNGWGRGRRFTLPARPWIRVTLREINLNVVIAREMKKELAKL